ncbi:MAG: NAD-dependent epimerase/dehydratase family protein [Candidatus Omnitrophota bacterium]|jgi:nucleoside-diphosphate-sugar epimerase
MYLITGGGGFLGAGLARRLTERGGMPVRVFDLRRRDNVPAEAEYCRGDIQVPGDIEKAVKGASVVFHLASLLPCARAKSGFYKVNTRGTYNLLDACRRHGVKRVVYLSSSSVYGMPAVVPLKEDSPACPVGDYGRSKLLAEEICLRYADNGMTVAIIRPRFIIGPGRLGLLKVVFDWVHENRNVYTIGSGSNRFQMVGIDDLIDACLLAASSGNSGIYNIGADNVPTVRELLGGLIAHARSASVLVPLNSALVKAGLRVLDALNLVPFTGEQYLLADKEYILDASRAKEEMGWAPRHSHEEMFNGAYDWYLVNKPFLGEENICDHPREKVLRLLKCLS